MAETQPVPANVSVTSASNASTISSLESLVIKLTKTVKVLVDCRNEKMREISNLKSAADRARLHENLSESEAFDLFCDDSCDGNMRIRLKANKKPKS